MPSDNPPALLGRILSLLPEAVTVSGGAVGPAPDWKGAYALAMNLNEPLVLSHRQADHLLAPGWYAYAGSAYGPGGVGARLRRHFRREKKLHWHVDRITTVASRIHAVALEGGSECDIVRRLIDSQSFDTPLEGFGNSDCRSCRSHLLRWRPQA